MRSFWKGNKRRITKVAVTFTGIYAIAGGAMIINKEAAMVKDHEATRKALELLAKHPDLAPYLKEADEEEGEKRSFNLGLLPRAKAASGENMADFVLPIWPKDARVFPWLSKEGRVFCSIRATKDGNGVWHLIGLHADLPDKRIDYDTVAGQWSQGPASRAGATRNFFELLREAPLWAQVTIGFTTVFVGNFARTRFVRFRREVPLRLAARAAVKSAELEAALGAKKGQRQIRVQPVRDPPGTDIKERFAAMTLQLSTGQKHGTLRVQAIKPEGKKHWVATSASLIQQGRNRPLQLKDFKFEH